MESLQWITSVSGLIAAVAIIVMVRAGWLRVTPSLGIQEKILIIVVVFFSPLLAPVLIYYGLRSQRPDIAKFANQVSFLTVLPSAIFYLAL